MVEPLVKALATLDPAMEVTFWGVRGSIPSPGPDTVRYGGNTPCVGIRLADNWLVLDAGSGIRPLGQHLVHTMGPTGHEITLLVTHTHWDHIQGLPFFASAFVAGNRITVAGPEIFSPGFEAIVSGQMQHSYFPLRLRSLAAEIQFRELSVGAYDDLVPGAVVSTMLTNHPVIDLAYRVDFGGRRLVYLMDHETWSDSWFGSVRRSSDASVMLVEEMVRGDLERKLMEFVAGADLLIADAVWTSAEYEKHVGWGHSTFEQVYELGRASKAKRVAFFHHEPNRTDVELAAIESEFRSRAAADGNGLDIFASAEGMTIVL